MATISKQGSSSGKRSFLPKKFFWFTDGIVPPFDEFYGGEGRDTRGEGGYSPPVNPGRDYNQLMVPPFYFFLVEYISNPRIIITTMGMSAIWVIGHLCFWLGIALC